jgi:exopolysaccharide/PEP-CTERM locus tyrosine autokinase
MKNTIEKALQRQKEAEAKQNATASSVPDKLSKGVDEVDQKPSISPDVASTTQVQEQPATANKVVEKAAVESENAALNTGFEIDLQAMERKGFVGLESARNLINEEYREIKRKLLQNAFGPLASTIRNSNVIMVSSARPSEGKTFTAVNLALSIAAEQDKTVLLVDADVLKPNVLKTLEIDDKNGLMEYLLGKLDDLSDVIYHTNIPKLRIIPAGQTHHLSTELLASTVMKDTVEEFSTRYPDRVVIIDTPPLIGINESAILANLAGQAVIVVEEGRSKLNDIKSAVERLNPDMAIGFVVNKSIQFSEKGGYYGYQYYGSDKKD